ncbi:zinc finger [Seminavis robusta]|uniref:Palmitoyltransferase n=1 Tax=Seminavis robusta TaxID=568900 RepID=A0A9N8H4H7_9STRA|nr:zinc finger [Seminavis robusta]|eukprot:Sro114_g056460.1 zinc finger (411) ;mRNA; f:80298-81530
MAVSVEVYVILSLYAVGMALTFYWCVLADPDKSPTAKLVTHTLPTKSHQWFSDHILGPKGTQVVDAIMEKLLAIIYLATVVGCYLVLVTYGYPKARLSSHVEEYHLRNGHILCALAIITWIVTMTANPGCITPETVQFYNHFPYDDLLYVQGRYDAAKGVPRLPRSKFDRLKYHHHVPRFDHYCGWVASTIGEENYRLFLFFVLTQLVLCAYATTLILVFFNGEITDHDLWNQTLFDRVSGLEFQVTRFVMLQFLIDRHLHETIVLAVVGVMTLLLTYFLGYHCYITSKGMTTNEHYKWGQVRKWHQAQVRRFETYKQQQQDTPTLQSQQPQQPAAPKPPVPDGDVGCTGGAACVETTTADAEPGMADPGPLPKNMYDKGLVENWKQVLFPISLRKKREAAKANDKRKAT